MDGLEIGNGVLPRVCGYQTTVTAQRKIPFGISGMGSGPVWLELKLSDFIVLCKPLARELKFACLLRRGLCKKIKQGDGQWVANR